MAKRLCRMVTAAESAQIWDRWQRSESLRLIGRVFGKTSSQIFASEAAWRDSSGTTTTIVPSAEHR